MAIFEELLEAMNQAYMLGLKLNLPSHELDAIRKTNPDPRECLLHCIPEEQLLNHCYSQASLVLYLKMTWTKVVYKTILHQTERRIPWNHKLVHTPQEPSWDLHVTTSANYSRMQQRGMCVHIPTLRNYSYTCLELRITLRYGDIAINMRI